MPARKKQYRCGYMRIKRSDDVVSLYFDTHTQFKKFRNYLRNFKYEIYILCADKLHILVKLNGSSYSKFLEYLLICDNTPLF